MITLQLHVTEPPSNGGSHKTEATSLTQKLVSQPCLRNYLVFSLFLSCCTASPYFCLVPDGSKVYPRSRWWERERAQTQSAHIPSAHTLLAAALSYSHTYLQKMLGSRGTLPNINGSNYKSEGLLPKGKTTNSSFQN